MKRILYLLVFVLLGGACQSSPEVEVVGFSSSVTGDVIYFGAAKSSQSIIINTNDNWFVRVDDNDDWLKFNLMSGGAGANQQVTLSVDENTEIREREIDIVFVCGHIVKTFSVKQWSDVEVTIDDNGGEAYGTVSPNLIGFNCIYSHTPDSFWANTTIKQEMTNMSSSFLRWPGGAPTNRYHWDDLNGEGWKDNWAPDYDIADDQPATNYTDLDEYMVICQETGATPLVGINMGSGLKYDRVEDGIIEAEALVQYCKDNNFNVEYFYLDNEPYHKGANYTMTWTEYADQIIAYAPRIKAINPEAKLVINWERVRDVTLWNILKKAGEHIDVVEVHWYWKHSEVTFDKWCESMPMDSKNKWYTNGGTYVEEIKYFYDRAIAENLPDLKLASLEWNVGPSAVSTDYPTKYENTIMQSEMLMQFMEGGLEFATIWPIFWPKLPNAKDFNPNRYLMDPTDNYSYSPSLDMFEMLSDALGKKRYKSESSDKELYSLVVASDDKIELNVYALSKFSEERWVTIKMPKYSQVIYELLKPDSEYRMFGSKSIQPEDAVVYDDEKGAYRYLIPAYSLAYLKFVK